MNAGMDGSLHNNCFLSRRVVDWVFNGDGLVGWRWWFVIQCGMVPDIVEIVKKTLFLGSSCLTVS